MNAPFSLILCITLTLSTQISAQISKGSKVFLTYDVKIEVDGKDAIQMLDSYVRNKTQLVIVDAKNEADFIFTLNMKIDGQKRIGLLKLTDAKKETEVWTSVWTKGSSLNQYYGYSGTRHSIGKIIKEQFLETFPTIEKKD